MNRGDIVLVALPGDYGKPRPAVIVQSAVLNAAQPASYVLCPITTTLTGQADIRIPVEPSPRNGLRARSEIMVDKVSTVSRRRLRNVIGRVEPAILRAVDRALLLVLGIA